MISTQVLTARALTRAAEYIEALGYSRSGLARALDIPASTVMGWFTRPTISLSTLSRLAESVGMEPAALILSDDDLQAIQDARDRLRSSYPGISEQLDHFLRGINA